MSDGEDFCTHLSNLCIKYKQANTVGANITDSDFREVILASLPSSWDNIIATLHQTPSLIDTIISLELHWSRVNQNMKVRTPGTTAVVLKANVRNDTYNKKVCVNANCRRCRHLIEDCYWKGGGKEGQFPPGFGQQGGSTGLAAGAANPTTKPEATANIAIIENACALCAMYDIPDIQPSEPDDMEVLRYYLEYTISRILDPPDYSQDGDEIAMITRSGEVVDRATYADSGASNHCFTNKSDFTNYEPFEIVQQGQAASRLSKFSIHGKGTVIKHYISPNNCVQLKLSNVLHTPDFTVNLILISQFDEAGFKVIFGEGKAQFIDPKGMVAVEVARKNGIQFDEAGFKVIFGEGKAQFIDPKGMVAVEVARKNGIRQDISHLRPISSNVYAKIPKEVNPSKLDMVSIKYTLIRYYGHNTYKLLDKETGEIVKARNVVFEEGTGHCMQISRPALHDEPIFTDELQPDKIPHNTLAPKNVKIVLVPNDHMEKAPDVDHIVTATQPNSENLPDAPATVPIQEPIAPRRSSRLAVPSASAMNSAEFKAREETARLEKEDWATNQTRPSAHIAVYDIEVDTADFQSWHMANFQTDLTKYIVLMADTNPITKIPVLFREAMKNPDVWMPAMQSEMDMMVKQGVFTKVPQPYNMQVISLKWVYGLKYNSDGEVIMVKAQLVAQGFSQIPGVDFGQTYASVARLESMRMCLAIIAHLGLELWQIDFVAAYLNSNNKFEVYTEQAPGFIHEEEEELVYHANKTLYRIMAGAHDWEEELSSTYNVMGYYQLKANPCVRH
ncbi:hypothetical protein CVT25_007497 [Psilocybe cyanescens]|uniref:Uncharacterized protein n=1 Tax=Psilocybe cyanescens TaxID=93625 RepID=A0A409XTN3_PSICY|nr:hypothetical protein CVT25_007497 [Psilocybe cyanescens]